MALCYRRHRKTRTFALMIGLIRRLELSHVLWGLPSLLYCIEPFIKCFSQHDPLRSAPRLSDPDKEDQRQDLRWEKDEKWLPESMVKQIGGGSLFHREGPTHAKKSRLSNSRPHAHGRGITRERDYAEDWQREGKELGLSCTWNVYQHLSKLAFLCCNLL